MDRNVLGGYTYRVLKSIQFIKLNLGWVLLTGKAKLCYLADWPGDGM